MTPLVFPFKHGKSARWFRSSGKALGNTSHGSFLRLRWLSDHATASLPQKQNVSSRILGVVTTKHVPTLQSRLHSLGIPDARISSLGVFPQYRAEQKTYEIQHGANESLIVDALSNIALPSTATGFALFTGIANHLFNHFDEAINIRLATIFENVPFKLTPESPSQLRVLPVYVDTMAERAAGAIPGSRVRISLPSGLLKVRMQHSDQYVPLTCEVTLFLRHRDHVSSNSSAAPVKDLTQIEEARRLGEVSARVLNALSDSMIFDRLDLVARLLAEGVLRRLGSLDWSVEIAGVKTRIQLMGDNAVQVTAQATFSSGVVSAPGESPDALSDVSSIARHDSGPGIPLDHLEEDDGLDMGTQGILQAQGRPLHKARTLRWSGRLDAKLGLTGLYLRAFSIARAKSLSPDTTQATAETMMALIRAESEKTSSTGLSSVIDIARSVMLALPHKPLTSLSMMLPVSEIRTLDASLPKLGGRLNFWVSCSQPSSIHQEPIYSAHMTLPNFIEFLSVDGTGPTVWVKVTFELGISPASDTLPTTGLHEWLPHLLKSVYNASLTTIKDEESWRDHGKVAFRVASRIVQSAGIFPECFEVHRIAIKVFDRVSGKLVSQGRYNVMDIATGKEFVGDTATLEETSSDLLGDKEKSDSRGDKERGGVFIAIGSNVGGRVEALEDACRAMSDDPDIDVLRTSNLYETEPMYVKDQARFLNGVCEIATTLSPMDLLDKLQSIEQNLGRVKTIDKGPRNIDLDILLYRQETVNTERLTIPHKLMAEREFVVRPLNDLTKRRLLWPVGAPRRPVDTLSALPRSSSPMHTFVPLTPVMDAIRSTKTRRPTHIMSILNTTPDSFSDGGSNEPTNMDSLRATVATHIAAGATIIDIGGQSSRPNAPGISAEEEIARILPAIKAVQSLPDADKVAISIDTYRATVAEAAVNAGAHIINDISAGLLDPDMLPTIARLGCTYIMMHMRGTPATMQNEQNCSYPEGLLTTIRSELGERLDAAEQAGIRRWRIILDPGIGFAKTPEQNLSILRRADRLRGADRFWGIPWLLGSSRKGFIGQITGVKEAKERTWGTAATVTAAVACGADIVRVHDVAEMAQVVKMADAIYRP